MLKNEGNPANEYLVKVQEDEDTEKFFQSVKLYNAALDDVKYDRSDLAKLKLNKAIELNEHNVKAMMLLSLILLQMEDHIRAGAYLLK